MLLVDDEPNITNALKRELEEWAEERSLDIVTAVSAAIGLNILETKHEQMALVISDLRMPEMKGSDFLLEVKKRYPEILTMLLTGYSETQEVIKAVSAGIFSYMLKPWEPSYLLAEVQKAFDHGQMLRQNKAYMKTVEEELKWAGEMQKAILKPNIPKSDCVEFRVSYRPVRGLYCGGDYYDVISIGADRYLLLVGDVAGHGVKAAMVTGILKAVIYPEYIRGVVGKEFSPAGFLSWLNDRMNYEFSRTSSMLVTFFAGVLDIKKQTIKYANAGHEHPFLLHQGTAYELPVSGTSLGFAQSITYAEQTARVVPGDTLLLYTDGLVEVACKDGTEQVKLQNVLKNVEPGEDFHKRLIAGALESAKASDFDDDVTILTAKVL